MKNILLLLLTFICFKSFAATSVDVISSEIGARDDSNRKTLCITVVRDPQSSSLLGIVETIEDCFYARAAKKSPDHRLMVNLKDLETIDYQPLAAHLQLRETQVTFYFSNGE